MFPFSNTVFPTISLEKANYNDQESNIYDYIIVGGGTAGCVLANRLSENPGTKVLLLERGDARVNWAAHVPLISTNFMGDKSAAYRWPSTPTENLTNHRQLNLVTGKGLGGGSAINSMQYTRGNPMEYNQWSRNGFKGWSYDEIMPYFLKSESYVGQSKSSHHGSDGEWKVRNMNKYYFPLAQSASDACVSLGIPYVDDLNDPEISSPACGRFDCTIDQNGHRSSTFFAFLPLSVVQERKEHLHICPGAAVIHLDVQQSKEQESLIRGVFFRSDTKPDEKMFYARARKEVILCAGAIGTPHLLLLSGIGPKEQIQRSKGKFQKILPGVGQNLQDHMAIGIMYSVPTAQSLHILQTSKLQSILELLRYVLLGEGLLLAPVTQLCILVESSRIDDTGYIRPHEPNFVEGIPDLEIMPIHFNYSDPPIPISAGAFSLKVGLMRPRSLGSVTLASENPLDRPNCDLGFLTDNRDLVAMRRGIKLAKRIGEKMRELGCNLTDLYMPESESDADLDTFVKKTARTTYHYACTCRMAPENDPRPGVVNDELRVYGVDNLRIADCSIIPDMLSTHLQAPAVMIAEKCADMVTRSSL
ncbi:alcohol oxidase [Lentinula novae-zelandiae]|nr:alcohol oxidase [Lentinula novae-zelandiae]